MLDHTQTPATLAGIEFIEIATDDASALGRMLAALGFAYVAKHRHKSVELYRLGQVNIIVNADQAGYAKSHVERLGTSISALGLSVTDAATAYAQLLAKGAWGVELSAGIMELNIPAIECIGGSQLFLVDGSPGSVSIFDVDFTRGVAPKSQVPLNLDAELAAVKVDVAQGRLPQWQAYFSDFFGYQAQGQWLSLSQISSQLYLAEQPETSLDGERMAGIALKVSDVAAYGEWLNEQGLDLTPNTEVGSYRVTGLPAGLNLAFYVSE